ncbi:hypothetical protein C8R46DRAFT_1077266 [Mycena filopes]|nr:hypothetical protein C8R46DRAFT_1077266 [Mycena filopes]
MTDAPPPSYNPRDSIGIATVVSELPTYTLQEEEPEPTNTTTEVEVDADPNTTTEVEVGADPGPLSPPPPATSSQNPSVESNAKAYSYELHHRSKPWATLTLLSDSRLSRSVPTFAEGSDIVGTIQLNLRNQDAIKSVDVLVRGDLVTGRHQIDRLTFFQMRKSVWATSMGDPRASVASGAEEWQEKLHGEYHWPFSVKFPELIVGPDGGQFHLPHTFAERFTRARIEYQFEMRIIRSKFRSDDRITAKFGFFSMQRPSRPSALRQLAYRDGTDFAGPYSDPDGWCALKPVQIRGTIFGERAVNAQCTVFLAKPLCYTRSSAIPCAMTIETEDSQAADILAAIKSSAVYLQRCVSWSFAGSSTEFSPCGQATWWPSSDIRNPAQRHLMGEIHLRKDLQPSSMIKNFQVQYDIVVFAPAAVAFKPDVSKPLITQSVEIVTRFAPGARPRLVTPAGSLAGPRVGLGIEMWSTG